MNFSITYEFYKSIKYFEKDIIISVLSKYFNVSDKTIISEFIKKGIVKNDKLNIKTLKNVLVRNFDNIIKNKLIEEINEMIKKLCVDDVKVIYEYVKKYSNMKSENDKFNDENVKNKSVKIESIKISNDNKNDKVKNNNTINESIKNNNKNDKFNNKTVKSETIKISNENDKFNKTVKNDKFNNEHDKNDKFKNVKTETIKTNNEHNNDNIIKFNDVKSETIKTNDEHNNDDNDKSEQIKTNNEHDKNEKFNNKTLKSETEKSTNHTSGISIFDVPDIKKTFTPTPNNEVFNIPKLQTQIINSSQPFTEFKRSFSNSPSLSLPKISKIKTFITKQSNDNYTVNIPLLTDNINNNNQPNTTTVSDILKSYEHNTPETLFIPNSQIYTFLSNFNIIDDSTLENKIEMSKLEHQTKTELNQYINYSETESDSDD